MGKLTKNYSLEEVPEDSAKIVCKECSRVTSHNIITSYLEKGSEDCGGGNFVDWWVHNQTIQCLGCETVSFRTVSANSEDVDYETDGSRHFNQIVKYYPARSEGLKDISSYLLPPNVQAIYKETVLAIENEQNVLAGIGIRALIETICKDQSAEGDDLYHKINSLQKKSIVTIEGVETLHKKK